MRNWLTEVLLDTVAALFAWGVAWVYALSTWVIFDYAFKLVTLPWVLLFILAAGQQPLLKKEFKEL